MGGIILTFFLSGAAIEFCISNRKFLTVAKAIQKPA
jgi:hypothetical protein